MKLTNTLASFTSLESVDAQASQLTANPGGDRSAAAYYPAQHDGVDFAPALRFGGLDPIWNGEKKPKDKDTVTCPVGQEPTIVIDGRDVIVTCGPASPDKPKGGFPVPIIY